MRIASAGELQIVSQGHCEASDWPDVMKPNHTCHAYTAIKTYHRDRRALEASQNPAKPCGVEVLCQRWETRGTRATYFGTVRGTNSFRGEYSSRYMKNRTRLFDGTGDHHGAHVGNCRCSVCRSGRCTLIELVASNQIVDKTKES